MLQEFLEIEANYKNKADAILQFINSPHIRKGEFEGNIFVIQKLDRENLIIYYEVVEQNGVRSIIDAFSIYRKNLQQAILEKAKTCGYEINEEYVLK